MLNFNHGAIAQDPKRDLIYYPEIRPGFVAWTTGFEYGNGDIGISFKETKRQENQNYVPAKLEMGEAVGAPVSYCSVECGSAVEESYRVYMISKDNGKSFMQTGKCQLESGSFCNMGFADGRIVGFDVPRINDEGTGWCNYIEVRESLDGGTTWNKITRLLEGTAPYLWRSRRLKDGTVILLASLYGTPWGEGQARTTRNTMLPGETYLSKIQTFFLTTKNGRDFSGPHYILPGVGAHEYDVVECDDGSLLFIAGDVQATPVARQKVERRGDMYINGTMFGIRRGAPQAPDKNPQGGFVPESMVMLKGDIIVGSRRNKPYSCSNDYGENWYEIDGLDPSLYQPYMMQMPNGVIANFGHFGGDAAFGQEDMYIGADFFTLENNLPASCTLSLRRNLSHDNSKYINSFIARLETNGTPVCEQEVTFRFTPVWNTDGTVNTQKQANAPIIKKAVTDNNGYACANAFEYDNIPDIHFYYNVDVVYEPAQNSAYRQCDGPMMCVAALTPHRENKYPYEAYFAEGALYLSPSFMQKHLNCVSQLEAVIGMSHCPSDLPCELVADLVKANVLKELNSEYKWYCSVHNEKVLDKVLPMAEGDWYV